jgi:hypothetical protein
MPHWKSLTDREYIYAFDLQGKEATVEITRVIAGVLTAPGGKKTKKPVMYFKGKDGAENSKPLALNSTNAKTIAALYGNDTDGWTGKRITLYTTTTEMNGEVIECIRIKPRAPEAK